MGEEALLAWLGERLGPDHRLGDDAALIPTHESDAWAISVDTQIEGVHFFPDLDPAIVARRLLAVNLSDLAAMGALPAWCVLALAAPAGFDHRRFFDPFIEVANAYGLELVGGDLARSPVLTAVLTIAGRRSGGRFVERSGARVGHELWLGGTVGEAALGLTLQQRTLDPNVLPEVMHPTARRAIERHQVPRPQMALGGWLADCSEGGALDVSDGVAKDLARLCAASGVGAELDEVALPIPADVVGLARYLDLDPIELALTGGEDYVLLFPPPPTAGRSGGGPGGLSPEALGATRIGRIVEGEGCRVVGRDGGRRPLPAAGFDHLAD
ncbi:MAG: thiamine-phosphate kinase [Acidobacteriota bacterium]